MASGGVFDDDAIRDIVESFEHPSMAVRGAIVVAVNDLWLAKLGYARDEIVGQAFAKLSPPEERDRLMQRALLPDGEVSFSQPLPTLVLTADGRAVPIHTFTSRFRASEPPYYRVINVLIDPLATSEVNIARDLLTLSANLIGADTEEQVRRRTLEGLALAQLSGQFWSPNVARDRDERVDVNSARSALEARRPIFAGARSTMPEAVYLPLDDGEVLAVSGHDLASRQSYTWGFFAKLLSTALQGARASEIAHRKLEGTQLLLQLARTTSETLDLDTVLNITAESLVSLLDTSSCFILLYDEATKVLRGAASSRDKRAVVAGITIEIDDPDSIAATAARERRMLVIGDTAADSLAVRSVRVQAFEVKATVAVPIVTRGRLEGVVMLDETRGPRTYSDEWIALASAIVSQVGLPISNARLYESLRRSYDEVAATRAQMVKSERLAALGELAAIVAHEVRNPLGVIFNASSSLGRIVANSPEGTTLLGIVREECERLNQIVGDLIDFARPRRLSTHREDMVRVLDEVVESISVERGVRFEVTASGELPQPVIDRRLIRQAILNVALNAMQSTPTNGVVRLMASTDPARSEVVVSVADEGPGIPPALLERIFEPFFTTKAKGAGLGLAVVKRIVEDHGGRVEVTSSTHGATFALHLPVSTMVAVAGA